MTTRTKLITALAGLSAFSLTLGAAASLVVDTDDLGAGTIDVSSCDEDGVDVQYVTSPIDADNPEVPDGSTGLTPPDTDTLDPDTANTSVPTYFVTHVQISGIDPDCVGQRLEVSLYCDNTIEHMLDDTVGGNPTSSGATRNCLPPDGERFEFLTSNNRTDGPRAAAGEPVQAGGGSQQFDVYDVEAALVDQVSVIITGEENDDADGDGDPDITDPDFDFDGDGVSNGDETTAGSDPYNAASKPESCDDKVDNDLDGEVNEDCVDVAASAIGAAWTMWADAEQISAAEGEQLETWFDQSVNFRPGEAARDLKQATLAQQPTFTSMGMGGGPAVVFDGSTAPNEGDHFTVEFGAGTPQGQTYVIAYTNTDPSAYLFEEGSTPPDPYTSQSMFEDGGQLKGYSGPWATVGAPAAPTGVVRLAVGVFESGSGRIYLGGGGSGGGPAGQGPLASGGRPSTMKVAAHGSADWFLQGKMSFFGVADLDLTEADHILQLNELGRQLALRHGATWTEIAATS